MPKLKNKTTMDNRVKKLLDAFQKKGEPATTIIAKLKKVKHVVIEAEFYDNGIQQMEFNVAGLQWAH